VQRSVIQTFTRWAAAKRITELFTEEENEAFRTIGYTIGGMMVFPGNRIDGKMTINGARGCNRKIADRSISPSSAFVGTTLTSAALWGNAAKVLELLRIIRGLYGVRRILHAAGLGHGRLLRGEVLHVVRSLQYSIVPTDSATYKEFALSTLDSGSKKLIERSQPASQSLIFQALAQEPRPRRGSAVELTPAALNWLSSGDVSAFQRVCGDGFVSAIHRGTRVHVLATYMSRNEQEKSSFSASLAASGFGANASANMSTAMTQDLLNNNTRFSISQQGGIPFGPPKSLDELKAMFTKTENFIERPAAFAVTITPYSSLGNYPSGTVLESPARLKRLGDYYLVIADLYRLSSDALQYALNPDLSSPYDPQVIEAYGGVPHLRAVKDAIHRDMKMLEAGITGCYRNRSGCDEAFVKKVLLKNTDDSIKQLRSSVALRENQKKSLQGFISKADKARR
jgi:hypothetical protein